MKDRERKTLMDWLTTKENTMNYEQLLQKTASIKKIDGIMEHKLLWLSSSQLVDRVDCHDVLVGTHCCSASATDYFDACSRC